MLLTAALIMGVMSTFTEVKLVHGSVAIRKLYTEGYTFSRSQLIAALSLGCFFVFGASPALGALACCGLAYASVTGKIADRVFVQPIVWNTVGSFVLSFIIGMLFSATGMTVMLGGVISTALSQAYFSCETFAHKTSLSYGNVKRNAARIKNEWAQPLADAGKMLLFITRVFGIPFALMRKFNAWYTARRSVAI